MTEQHLAGAGRVLKLAFELADSGSFYNARQVVAALTNLRFDVSPLSAGEVLDALNAACLHAFQYSLEAVAD
jgi:hypothetical protein